VLEMERILHVVRRWWRVLVGACLIGGVVAYVGTKVLVKQQFEATAIISMSPAPQGPNGLYVTTLAASADAQLVQTLATAETARRALPRNEARGILSGDLSRSTVAASSIEGELLFITVRWPDVVLLPRLANAMANAFIRLERARLEQRYAIIHAGLGSKESYLLGLMRSTSGGGQALSWLQAQYADSLSKLHQQDADARIQASLQEVSLQIDQPASADGIQKVGPRATVNAVLGAVLALLIALVIVFALTTSYSSEDLGDSLRPVLTAAVE
jgi:hypothetical protein